LQVELGAGRLHVRRAKNGSPSVHPLRGVEIRVLRRLQREQGSRAAPLSVYSVSCVRWVVTLRSRLKVRPITTRVGRTKAKWVWWWR